VDKEKDFQLSSKVLGGYIVFQFPLPIVKSEIQNPITCLYHFSSIPSQAFVCQSFEALILRSKTTQDLEIVLHRLMSPQKHKPPKTWIYLNSLHLFLIKMGINPSSMMNQSMQKLYWTGLLHTLDFLSKL